ncbi:hypothetical protein Dsin_022505 [Dipteronia sinensis]|uniref:Endonuclease/exonuclease/phosphatase domain-containing protein n=1 Tax=Dipteronia sinensis TaxID=43782 RepID=A0AAE0DZU2_9ROSI|nr:hypothetical protein Dsin_022505 [Dipteronia sinensis]
MTIGSKSKTASLIKDRGEGDKRQLWNFLIEAQSQFPCPWIIGGDFNAVLHPSERKWAGFNLYSARNFNTFILKAKVVDLPMQGSEFTWTNSRDGAVWASLDRFLLSPLMLTWFLNLEQRGLSRSLSDHNAIILSEPTKDWGPSPFRIYNWWTEDTNMKKEAAKSWLDCKEGGSTGHIISAKLKATKESIKMWISSNKTSAFFLQDREKKLFEIDLKALSGGWSDQLRSERFKTLEETWKGIRRNEQMWSQKARVKWTIDGDRNSKYFHIMANGRRRHNQINVLNINGVRCTDPPSIREGIFDHFKRQYQKLPWQRQSIHNWNVKSITDSEREDLEKSFSKEELWEAVSNCDGDKASGPDGLNLSFVKDNWDVIQTDFMSFLQDFHRFNTGVKDINQTFITLIPKTLNPSVLGDYRPISLVNSLYKVLSKVLANRIKRVMNSVIGEYQSAFVKGCQIMDSFIIAEEIIQKWKKED